MTLSPNQSAFIAANEIVARLNQTANLFVQTLPILQEGLADDLYLGHGFEENDKTFLHKTLTVMIKHPAQDVKKTIPELDKSTPLNHFRSLAKRASNAQNTLVDKNEDWLRIWFNPSGTIQIKSGTPVDGFLNNSDAAVLQAGTYQDPNTIVAQMLLAISQNDQTENSTFRKLIHASLQRAPIATPK